VSNLKVRAMLAQNPIEKCDQLIAYASKFLNNAKKNYTTIEREAFAMVYVLNKSRHYLFKNKFVFNVDHMALLYLIKKPQLSIRIVRWLLLFLGYDFLVVYKPTHFHLVVEALSQLLDATKNLKVFDKNTNTSLFVLKPKLDTLLSSLLDSNVSPR
jgi:hypothetical protein